MTIALAEIARMVEGRLVGDDLPISGAATIVCARPGDITLADKARLAPKLARSQASAVIVGPQFEPEGIPYITVRDVHAAFARVVKHFHPPRPPKPRGISPAAHVSPSARLADDVQVFPNATIGEDVVIGKGSVIHPGVQIMDGCRIGRGVTIFPNVTLYENTIVGDRVIIHSGVVIGAYGFGYSLAEGKHKLSHQLGYVEIGDDVEIGACSSIDRGTYGPTIIGEGTKIDNQVQIAHNCRIGRHNLFCSQVGMAGSTTTGDYVVIAGQAGIREHVHIGEGAIIGAQSGVMNDIPAGQRVFGFPAIPERDQLLCWATIHKLPAMRRKLLEIERSLRERERPPRVVTDEAEQEAA